ncbi:MAG: APC family permease [Bryobacteraceae bacterium]
MPAKQAPQGASGAVRLQRALTLWDLVIYGIVLIQPTAPMPLFGVVSQEARGHVVTTILIAMVAMLFTAISYGRMARAYPSAGSAFTYVGREFHPFFGYITGWSMAMDYLLNPILCTIWCSEAARNIAPEVPYAAWVFFIAMLFTGLNLRGIRANARTNTLLAGGMGVVIVIFLAAAARYIFSQTHGPGFFTLPFYNPRTFSPPLVFTGVSIAVLTYIGFDGISTLSEEVRNPRRNIIRATVLVCLITGVLASVEVYAAQLIWPSHRPFPEIDTAFSFVAGQAVASPGAPAAALRSVWLFQLVNLTLLVASAGSGSSAQLAAARLLYGMGRSNALPKKFFGAIEPKNKIPRNNVILVGALALAGAFALTYQLSAELLNFGAFIAFIGVNLAAINRYFVRGKKTISNLAPPLAGALICFYIWLNLRTPAKIAGGAWLCLGILYGAWKTNGFRGRTISFDLAPDD